MDRSHQLVSITSIGPEVTSYCLSCFSDSGRSQTDLEWRDSALYIHATFDTMVTWQISTSAQCNSDI